MLLSYNKEYRVVISPIIIYNPIACKYSWSRVLGTDVTRSQVMPTEKAAREHFAKHKVEHYWDLAYSGAVLAPAAQP